MWISAVSVNTVIFAKCCKIDMLFCDFTRIFNFHWTSFCDFSTQHSASRCLLRDRDVTVVIVLCCSLSVAVRIVVYFYVWNVNIIKSNAGCWLTIRASVPCSELSVYAWFRREFRDCLISVSILPYRHTFSTCQPPGNHCSFFRVTSDTKYQGNHPS